MKKGRKVLSSKARRRQEKGYDKALAVMEKTAVKVEKSKGQLKAVHARRKTWDEINKENEKLSKVRPVVEVKDGVTNGWETDEDMDDAEAEQPEAAAALPDDPLPEPQTNDVEDEIL